MAEAKRDQNYVTTLIGVSSADGITPVTIYVDPITHRMLVSMTSGSLSTLTDVTITSVAQGDVLYYNGTKWVNLPAGTNGYVLTSGGAGANPSWTAAGSGTVTSVSVTTANGVSGSVATATTTPAITLTLGVITPTSVNGLTITANGTNTLNIAAGKTLVVSNSITLAGTDSTVMTFPSTSATIARTDAGQTFTGVQTMTSPAITTPQIIGIATGTGVATAGSVNTLALRDANGNLTAVNHLEGFTSTATAAGTTTLTVASNYQQFFTGSTTQTVTLPVATTLVNGQSFLIHNNSTGLVTVQTSGSNSLIVLAGSTSAIVTCVNTAGGTGTASWDAAYYGDIVATGKKLTVSNSITIAGTDAETLTLTKGLTVTTNAGTLAFSGASKTLTIADSTTLGTNSLTFAGGEVITFSATNALSLLTTGTSVMTFPTATDTVVCLATTQTLTNKRITARVQSVADAATVTPNADSDDCVDITAIAQAFTIANPSGTPTNFQKLIIRIKDNGTARAITWGNGYVAGGVALPSTTVLSKILTLGFIYNTANTLNKWQLVASAQEA